MCACESPNRVYIDIGETEKLRAEAMESIAGHDGYVGIAKNRRGSNFASARARARLSQRAETAKRCPKDAIFTCFFNDWRGCAYIPRFGTQRFDGDELT
jgi:hypothetical protein